VLRHNLSQFESCDARGFVPVEDAIREISKSKKCKKGITADIVATIVEQERLHGKERLQLKQNDQKQWLISATQGHSSGRTEYDAVLEPCEFLLHGTEARFKESIEQKGLLKMHRTHIHCISCDPAKLDSTKIKIGSRAEMVQGGQWRFSIGGANFAMLFNLFTAEQKTMKQKKEKS
jgi:RNA:NAD 2'-phosphotransferase (TPT1/KptA family)